MRKMTNYEIMGAQALLSAIPMNRMPGKAVAAVAIAIASLSTSLKPFNEAIGEMAKKLKPEGYDEKYMKRQEEIKKIFPEGTPFDAKKWEQACTDKDFEETFQEVEKAFSDAYQEAAKMEVETTANIDNETLAAIADALCEDNEVKVGEDILPFPVFMSRIALLAV